MEILGVGPSEFVFIVLIAIVFLGPKKMQDAGRTVGRWLVWANTSEFGQLIRNTVAGISNLPTKLMREANLEKWEEEMKLQNILDPAVSNPPRTSFKRPAQTHQPPQKPKRKTASAEATAEKSEKPATKKKDD